MEIDLQSPKTVVKIEQPEGTVTKQDQSSFVSSARRQKMKTCRKHMSITRVWVATASRKRTENFAIVAFFCSQLTEYL